MGLCARAVCSLFFFCLHHLVCTRAIGHAPTSGQPYLLSYRLSEKSQTPSQHISKGLLKKVLYCCTCSCDLAGQGLCGGRPTVFVSAIFCGCMGPLHCSLFSVRSIERNAKTNCSHPLMVHLFCWRFSFSFFCGPCCTTTIDGGVVLTFSPYSSIPAC